MRKVRLALGAARMCWLEKNALVVAARMCWAWVRSLPGFGLAGSPRAAA